MPLQQDTSLLKSHIQQIEFNLKSQVEKKYDKITMTNFKYDGGLLPIIIYNSNKYKLKLPLHEDFEPFNKINNFHEISHKIYNKIKNNNTKIDELEDIFSDPVVKKYYIENTYESFSRTLRNFKNIKEKQDKNANGDYVWVTQINNIILSIIAFTNNYKLGLKDKKDFKTLIKDFNIILNEYLENYIQLIELEDEDMLTIWLIGIYLEDNENSKEGSKEKSRLLVLFREMTINVVGKLLESLLYKDYSNDSNIDMIKNWLSYGIIRDHLHNNSKTFLEKYNLKEGFSSRLERASIKKKDLAKKTYNYPTWKVYLAWICFIILIYVSARVFMYMSSKLFSLKMINE
jgi:hypothetical protein